MTTPWTVTPEWKGETAAILASGPSMTRAQADAVRGKCRVIAVNNSGIDTECNGALVPALAPWADILFAGDAKWWHCYKDRALKFPGRKVCLRPSLPFPQVYSLKQSHKQVFDERPQFLVQGGNSGYMALHLAVHLGAKRIILLGFDMGFKGKQRHWFGNHPPRLNSRPNFTRWIHAFGKLAPVLQKKGIQVINCTPTTALRCFKKAPLEMALNGT